MLAYVLRKLGRGGAISNMWAVVLVASALAGMAALPASAQLYSPGYEFLKAVDERDGDTATSMLNDPASGRTLVNSRDLTSGETGLHIVTKRRDALWIRFLIQRGADPNIRDKEGVTALQIATRMGFIDGVEQLLKGGAQVSVSDRQGETPLIAAVHQRNAALVGMLLEKGADPDRNDNSGRSARDYIDLMSQNTLLKLELEKAEAQRKGEGTQKQYGPSF